MQLAPDARRIMRLKVSLLNLSAVSAKNNDPKGGCGSKGFKEVSQDFQPLISILSPSDLAANPSILGSPFPGLQPLQNWPLLVQSLDCPSFCFVVSCVR